MPFFPEHTDLICSCASGLAPFSMVFAGSRYTVSLSAPPIANTPQTFSQILKPMCRAQAHLQGAWRLSFFLALSTPSMLLHTWVLLRLRHSGSQPWSGAVLGLRVLRHQRPVCGFSWPPTSCSFSSFSRRVAMTKTYASASKSERQSLINLSLLTTMRGS